MKLITIFGALIASLSVAIAADVPQGFDGEVWKKVSTGEIDVQDLPVLSDVKQCKEDATLCHRFIIRAFIPNSKIGDMKELVEKTERLHEFAEPTIKKSSVTYELPQLIKEAFAPVFGEVSAKARGRVFEIAAALEVKGLLPGAVPTFSTAFVVFHNMVPKDGELNVHNEYLFTKKFRDGKWDPKPDDNFFFLAKDMKPLAEDMRVFEGRGEGQTGLFVEDTVNIVLKKPPIFNKQLESAKKRVDQVFEGIVRGYCRRLAEPASGK